MKSKFELKLRFLLKFKMETPVVHSLNNTFNPNGSFGEFELRTLSSELNPQPPFQRVIDGDRVNMIIQGLLDEKKRLGLNTVTQTGIIQIGQFGGFWYILDGQHRFRAYCKLNEPQIIRVQIWKFLTSEEMYTKFKEINSNVMIEDYVKNGDSNKRSYDKIIDYVQNTYKYYLKQTENPIFPNINI